MGIRIDARELHPWGNVLKKTLKEQGRSLEWVALRLHVNRSTLYRWMKQGPNDPWISKNVEQILGEPGLFRRFYKYEI